MFPLKELLELIRHGLMNVAMAAFTRLAEEMMGYEVTALVGPKNQDDAKRIHVRWGSEPGYCVVGGQKVPLARPRVRDTSQRDVPLAATNSCSRPR